MEPILTLKNISAYDRDGRALLPDTDLTVMPGKKVRIITERPRFEALARIIGGLVEPDNGEIALRGQPIQKWHPLERAAHIGYMSPDPGLWDGMTILNNTALPLIAAGVSRYERKEVALNMLENLGIGYAAHTYPKSLGFCEQRLAALARALVTGPELLILADPTSMLDEKESRRFLDALSARLEADGFAVLYWTWIAGELLPADKTIYLATGEIEQ